MSFQFEWPRFSESFHRDACQMLDAALNKGNKPPIIADRIEVVELEMGKQPPELEIRDIGDLTVDQFRGIFRLSYAGDAHIVLRTKVQANPLNNKKSDFDGVLGTSRGILAAHQPLVVPMHLRLSHFRLNAYVVLVVSKQKGITLVFKTDPLQNVEVSSTFDSIAVIQKYIQREIEGQLREMFREDLPGIIHRLSQRWLAGRAKVETPYAQKPRGPISSLPSVAEHEPTSPRASERPLRFPTVGLQPALSTYSLPTPAGLAALRPRLSVAPSMAGSGRGRQPSSSLNSPTTSSLPPLVPSPIDPPETPDSDIDQEHFDPTYGLRPEGLPSKSSYSGFSKLYVQNRGLGDLTDGTSSVSRPSSVQEESAYWEEDSPDLSDGHDEPGDEYETIPAVGGGTITRPKATGSVALPPKPAKSLLSPFQSESGRGRKMYSNHQSPLKQWVGHQEALRRQMGLGQAGSVSLPTTPPPRAPLSRAGSNIRYEPQHQHQHQHQHERRRGASSYFGSSAPTGSRSSVAGRTISTPPSSELPASGGEEPALNRKRSLSPSMVSPTYSREVMHYNNDDPNVVDPEPEIVLRPGLNTTVTQLSALSQTNHTLSLFAPSVQGVTVRSVPRRPGGSVSATPHAERVPVKARRKRVYRVGKKKEDPSEQGSQVPLSPTTSQSEYGHYFRHPESLYARTDDERF
ncbi:mitochondrial distribution and morphology protein 34 [Rhizoctonia solani]|uniref:Mitochondrial distribution and morphology protein 34 n=1 Tax=Rhizoctonia solani TaxID=456999 RepID=A0A8H8NNZ4_9AGAM|nr:mitochondrial distribution and morphology protein 34 [Rhizoctonia solani]QRW15945.1 mitochondrial distribution and morphology protein 34 [Rhizoctonia solani]